LLTAVRAFTKKSVEALMTGTQVTKPLIQADGMIELEALWIVA
jgi:hypothetical protein